MPELALWLPFLGLVALIGWMYHVVAHRPGGQPIGALEAAFTKLALLLRRLIPGTGPRPAEVATHWWATYYKHHREKLSMVTSTFDPCLLITNSSANGDAFGVVGLQTDDTLILGNAAFQDLEEKQLKESNFMAKPKQILTPVSPLLFNGCTLSIDDNGTLTIRQKDQGKKISIIKDNAEDAKQQYIQQRARGAYIASICQPEASFDMSTAAQSGAHWHDLPERYGKYKSVHKRFSRWSASGVWDKVFRDLVADRRNLNLMIDSTIVRAHQQAATGRKKGARTRLWGVPEEV